MDDSRSASIPNSGSTAARRDRDSSRASPDHSASGLILSHRCLQTLLASLPEAVIITTLTGEIVVANEAAAMLFGQASTTLTGTPLQQFFAPPDLLTDTERAALETKTDWLTVERAVPGLNGRLPSPLQICLLRSETATPTGIVWYWGAIGAPLPSVATSEPAAQRRTDAILKRYQLLSDYARDMVLFLQPDGHILEANQAAAENYGYTTQDLTKLAFSMLHADLSPAEVQTHLAQAAETGVLYETTHQRQDQSHFPVEVSLQQGVIDGEALILAIIRDISSRKRSEEKLFRSAFHDPVTHLPNRTLFLGQLQQSLQKASQERGYQFAVLFLDLDGFKVVNDSLGHLVGDQLLGAIAQRLLKCLSADDTLARFGGDEFVILQEHITSLEEAMQLAQALQRELAQPFDLRGQSIYTTTSIGIVLSRIGSAQPEELIRNADTALHRAKALGGNRFVVFDTEMHSNALARLIIENDLRRALADTPYANRETAAIAPHHTPLRDDVSPTEFVVYYQPIITLRNERISSFEALIRWRHPERGLVPPGQFIPIAEETGLIIPIGYIVLRDACRQLRRWHQQFPQLRELGVSVNLSVKQFTQPDLVEQIERVLTETGIPPETLKLEITESALMENAEVAARMLDRLHQLGVQLSLDDFGTGYSSLAYLHRFPIDILKIDRSFVSKVHQAGEQLEIVRSIVTLAWNLGIDVVAEGVETTKHLLQLKSLRCEYGQGYLFSKPVDAEAATQILADAAIAPESAEDTEN